ncbi:hypothetical protein OGAPHI_005384 [Ogataea philodendri]|uniref:Telomere length regulation protein conserved domain-containing protein n=1 Tax=Ogataea philodendri TaxID=1378263 RepID=A0A9P8T2Q1_9ASCO|nr:uncharacterized protein OGAPHI_005384 [Ogataea philodendri]KAH3663394.1 hypothetical protein OGAPHI_005384 [Ogataea philodendri]
MMDLDSLMEELKSGSSDLARLLRRLQGFDKDTQRLRICVALIDQILPVYRVVDSEVRALAVDLLCCRVGISQLLVKTRETVNENSSDLLADIVSSPKFDGILGNEREFSELRGLLTVRVMETLNRASLELHSGRISTVADLYPEWLLEIALRNKVDWRFINSCLRMKKVDYFRKEVFLSLVERFNRKPDYTFLQQLLHSVDGGIDESNAAGFLELLKILNINDWPLVASMVTKSPVHTQKVVTRLMTNAELVLEKQLSLFALKSYIQQTPIGEQERLTNFVLLLLMRLDNAQVMDISTRPVFLNAISNHLESNTNKIRFLGMCVGDVVYQRLNGKPMFNIDEHNRDRDNLMASLEKPIADCSLEEAFVLVRQKSTQLQTLAQEHIIIKPTPVTIDSDPEDSDDDTVPPRKTVPNPVYLKEVVSYLQAESQTDQLAFEKHQAVFKILAPLVRTKLHSQELEFYSESLLDLILGLPNTYKFEEFESWRLSCCIAICVGDFEQATGFLIKCFVTGDLSLNKRILILSCLSLTARERSGIDDSFIAGKDPVPNVGAQKLPEHIHQQFLKYEQEPGETKKELKNISDGLETLQLTGTVTRISARLTNKKPVKTKDTKFINNQLPKMYFLLVSVWQFVDSKTQSGFQVGSFSAILNAHFLKTLALILDCGIPSSIQVLDMIRELTLVLIQQLKQLLVTYENLVMEAVVTCLQTILQYDGGLLQQTLFSQFQTIQECLVIILNNNQLDEQVVNNCRIILGQLDRITPQL